MSNEEQLAQLIIEYVKGRPNVRGAVLGAYVNVAYPGLHLRASFGGLKQFINRFCNGQVRAMGKHGTDDVYQYISAPDIVVPESTVSTETNIPFEHESAWKAFSSPSSEAFLWVFVSTGEMRAAPTNQGLDMELWRQIPKVTTDEHRVIARSFLLQIDERDRNDFQNILLTSEFWDVWFNQIRSFMQGKYFKRWLSFRFNQICELFIGRVKALKIPDAICGLMLDSLKGSKSERVKSNALFVEKNNYIPAVTVTNNTSTKSSVRAAVLRAVNLMSEDELRGIWLPIGVIADGLRGEQS